jgi:hypothetical protein
MNDINAVLTGRIEDKWIEFVATEFADRARATSRYGRAGGQRAVECFRRVEVRASYIWLFAGALLAWWLQ